MNEKGELPELQVDPLIVVNWLLHLSPRQLAALGLCRIEQPAGEKTYELLRRAQYEVSHELADEITKHLTCPECDGKWDDCRFCSTPPPAASHDPFPVAVARVASALPTDADDEALIDGLMSKREVKVRPMARTDICIFCGQPMPDGHVWDGVEMVCCTIRGERPGKRRKRAVRTPY